MSFVFVLLFESISKLESVRCVLYRDLLLKIPFWSGFVCLRVLLFYRQPQCSV